MTDQKTAYLNHMHNLWGHLADFWYPLIESKALKPNTLKRIRAFSTNYVAWKNSAGEVSLFPDSCLHKKMPLSEGSIKNGQLHCPYHGWQFSHSGQCSSIPYATDESLCAGKALYQIPARQCENTIWFFPGDTTAESFDADLPWDNIPHDIYSTRVISSDIQAIIENFMDSPHTNHVHTGLIRRSRKPEERQVSIELKNEKVLYVAHQPVYESVGPFQWFVNPEKQPLSHNDIFRVPAEVDIEYCFEKNRTNFRAHILMCPVEERKTRVFFKISCNFSRLNSIVRFGVRLFLPIVLWQDMKILGLQSANKDNLPNHMGDHLPYDMYSYQIRLMREKARTRKDISGLLDNKIETSLRL